MTDRLNEILNNYKFWDDQVKRKNREIKRLRERETSSEIAYSDMPKATGSAHTLADYAAELDQLEADLRELRQYRGAAYDDIFSLLVRMKSSAQIDVIYRRYIILQTWPEICRGRDISKCSALECHDRAIIVMEKLIDPTSSM